MSVSKLTASLNVPESAPADAAPAESALASQKRKAVYVLKARAMVRTLIDYQLIQVWHDGEPDDLFSLLLLAQLLPRVGGSDVLIVCGGRAPRDNYTSLLYLQREGQLPHSWKFRALINSTQTDGVAPHLHTVLANSSVGYRTFLATVPTAEAQSASRELQHSDSRLVLTDYDEAQLAGAFLCTRVKRLMLLTMRPCAGFMSALRRYLTLDDATHTIADGMVLVHYLGAANIGFGRDKDTYGPAHDLLAAFYRHPSVESWSGSTPLMAGNTCNGETMPESYAALTALAPHADCWPGFHKLILETVGLVNIDVVGWLVQGKKPYTQAEAVEVCRIVRAIARLASDTDVDVASAYCYLASVDSDAFLREVHPKAAVAASAMPPICGVDAVCAALADLHTATFKREVSDVPAGTAPVSSWNSAHDDIPYVLGVLRHPRQMVSADHTLFAAFLAAHDDSPGAAVQFSVRAACTRTVGAGGVLRFLGPSCIVTADTDFEQEATPDDVTEYESRVLIRDAAILPDAHARMRLAYTKHVSDTPSGASQDIAELVNRALNGAALSMADCVDTHWVCSSPGAVRSGLHSGVLIVHSGFSVAGKLRGADIAAFDTALAGVFRIAAGYGPARRSSAAAAATAKLSATRPY